MKKGFSLVELVGVISLLGILALILHPIVSETISKSKQKSYNEQINRIEDSAEQYGIHNTNILPERDGISNVKVSLQELISAGYLKKTENGKIYNPLDKSEMQGCVIIQYDTAHKQYKYKYDELCGGQIVGTDTEIPVIGLDFELGAQNNGWYVQPVDIIMNAADNVGISQIKYCMGNDCTPNIVINDSTKTLTVDNLNDMMVCAISIDTSNNKSNKVCTEPLKVDAVAPIFSGVSDVVIEQNANFDVNEGVSVIDSGSGLVGTYEVTPTSIDTSVLGINEIVYAAVDVAGNVNTITRKVIVDADAPTIDYEVIDVSSVNGWYNEAFYLKATITDKSQTGIKESYSCVSTDSSECIPTTELTELEKTFYIDSQGSNRICIKTIDNNNKETTLCSDIYKLDAIAPTITPTSENIIVMLGENEKIASYFNTIYSISGSGTMSCSHNNTTQLGLGNQEISCTATGNNGLTASSKVTVMVLEQKINYTMLYDKGNEFTDITGGWSTISSMTVSKGATSMTFTATSGNRCGAGPQNIIDLTPYSYITTYLISGNFTGTSMEQSIRGFYTRDVTNLDYTDWVIFGTNTGNYSSYSISNKLFGAEISVEGSRYIGFFKNSVNGSYTWNATTTNVTLYKPDNWQKLCECVGINIPTSLSNLLSDSVLITSILSNETAVKYMILQCTGDFMANAIQSETFKTALESSPYKDMVYANEHWNKFLNIAVE